MSRVDELQHHAEGLHILHVKEAYSGLLRVLAVRGEVAQLIRHPGTAGGEDTGMAWEHGGAVVDGNVDI